MIRDTIDCREFLNEEVTKLEYEENVFEEARMDKPSIFLKNSLSKNSQSTPMSVKKKLQEHGLLDMTNSPHKEESPKVKTNEPINVTTKQPKAQKKNSSPKKKFNFSPIAESPCKQPTILSALANSPLRFYLKTPTKTTNTPMKSVLEDVENNNRPNEETVEKSVDSSFEFREQLLKKSKGKSGTQNKTKANRGYLERNLSDVSNDVASPRKSQNRAKRFKQLTMTQAFASQSETGKSSSVFKSSKVNETNQTSAQVVFRMGSGKNLAQLEETCIEPNDLYDNAVDNFQTVKNEPTTQVCQK